MSLGSPLPERVRLRAVAMVSEALPELAPLPASLRKVAGRPDHVYWPTHGPAIPGPQRYVEALVRHREERERQVLDQVRGGVGEIPAMVAVLYANVDEKLHKPAGRSVLSHLVKLVDDGKLSNKLARQVVEGVLAGEGEPEQVMKGRGLEVVRDDSALQSAVD